MASINQLIEIGNYAAVRRMCKTETSKEALAKCRSIQTDPMVWVTGLVGTIVVLIATFLAGSW